MLTVEGRVVTLVIESMASLRREAPLEKTVILFG